MPSILVRAVESKFVNMDGVGKEIGLALADLEEPAESSEFRLS